MSKSNPYEFRNEELNSSFTLPEKPTVREILAYESIVEIDGQGKPFYERLWDGARSMIEEWDSPVELTANTKGDDLSVIPVIKWASLAVFSYVQELKKTEKN